jgi:DNA-binding NtrC family response regulator
VALASHPSTSILLIDPDPALQEILAQSFLLATADICQSFEEAVEHMPFTVYQLLICPYRIASLDQYQLLTLNLRHNPSAPFIVTMSGQEFAFMQQAIEYGALGVLDGMPTTQDVVHTVRPLLWLYRLRFSLDRREQWMADFRNQIRNNPVQGKSEALVENRLLCEQALVAIEGGMQALRAHASELVVEAKERMRSSHAGKSHDSATVGTLGSSAT